MSSLHTEPFRFATTQTLQKLTQGFFMLDQHNSEKKEATLQSYTLTRQETTPSPWGDMKCFLFPWIRRKGSSSRKV